MGRLSLTGQRILAGVALAQMLFFVANYYVFRFFEPHDKSLLIASGVIAGFCVFYLGPTVEELRDYRAKRRSSDE
jgi:hypothetical protein